MKLFPCLLLFLSPLRLLAQNQTIERIGVSEGLSAGFVTYLQQDREGFLWMGTQNGLNRYDGHRFRIFTHDIFDSLSLSSDNISVIHDLGDFILVGTIGGGLNIFHKKTERFYRVPFETLPNAKKRMPGNAVVEILVDKAGTIWLMTGNYFSGSLWLCRMELPKNFWQQLLKSPGEVSLLTFSSWDSPVKTKDDWFTVKAGGMRPFGNSNTFGCFSGEGWSVFNPVTQQLEKLPLPKDLVGQLAKVVFSEKGDSYWQNYEGVTWHRSVDDDWVRLPGKLPIILFFNQTFLLARSKDFIGAYKITDDPQKIDFSHPLWKLPTLDRRNMFIFDRSGNFWWAEQADGVYKYNPQKDSFRHYFQGTSVMNTPACLVDGSIVFTNEYQLYWAQRSDGSNINNRLRQAFAQYKLTFNTIKLDKSGQCWRLGTRDAKAPATLIRIDPETGNSKTWELPFHLKEEHGFTFDEKGRLWFAIERKLICFDPIIGACSTFDFRQLGMKDEAVAALTKTGDGSWWLATKYGLIRAKPNNNQQFDFKLFQPDPNDPNSLSSSVIACLLTDPTNSQVLWIGTKGGGLNRFDIQTNHFIHFTTKNGFPDNVVYGILTDTENRLWLSTNRGLVRYNSKTGELKNYRQADGLQSDEFNTRAYGYGQHGELMFGGVNGLNVFKPESVWENSMPPKVIFTGLKINNRPIDANSPDKVLNASIAFSEAVVLPYSKNNITLEFAALEFTAASKNRYRYYLSQTNWWRGTGENEWAHESAEPSATYLNLQPGDYIFHVKAANGDGVWNEAPTTFCIRVLPPWYRSWWACGIYTLLVNALVFWFWYSRKNRKALEMALEKKKREAEQAAWALEREQQAAEKTALELEATQLEAKYIQEANQIKLEEFTRHLLEKSHIITDLQTQLKTDSDKPQSSEDREQMYRTNILTQADWEVFKQRFEQAYPGFQQKLETYFPQISTNELRLMLLARMGLTTATEVASMLGISAEAVRKARYRLRKKLDMPDASLEDILSIVN